METSIVNANSKILIGSIYRPPNGNIDEFTDQLHELLCNNRLKTIIAGDFNINLIKSNAHLPTSRFLNTTNSLALMPTITKPTRLTSRSLIDNIFCNATEGNQSGIVCSDISDHCPIFLLTPDKLPPQSTVTSHKRPITEHKLASFKERLQSTNWVDVYSANNAQDAFTTFHTKYQQLYTASFPTQAIQTQYKSRKPWLTAGLKQSIKTKNKLYLKYLRRPSDGNKTAYKIFRNRLNALIRKTERDHYHRIIADNKSNMKKNLEHYQPALR